MYKYQSKSIRKTMALMVAAIFIALFSAVSANACEIDFKIIKNKKETYSPGDVVIAKVTVIYTHRHCPEGIDATKFDTKGIEVLGATKWTETSTGTWERKLKLKINDDAKEKATINAIRTCDKEGGFGALTLEVA